MLTHPHELVHRVARTSYDRCVEDGVMEIDDREPLDEKTDRESLLARGLAALFALALLVAVVASFVGGDGPYG